MHTVPDRTLSNPYHSCSFSYTREITVIDERGKAIPKDRAGRKGFPKDILIAKADKKRLPRGHFQFRIHDQLVAMSWFDRRGVYLLSTIHPPKNPDGTLPTIPRKNER